MEFTRLLPSLMLSSLRKSLVCPIPFFTQWHVSRCGLCTVSGPVFSQLVSGSLHMSVATRHSPSPSLLTTVWVGCFTRRAFFFHSIRHVHLNLKLQVRRSISLLEDHTCKAPCNDGSYDSGPSVRSKNTISTRFASF